MLQPIFDFIENLANNFSWRKVVILITLLLTISGFWLLYESQTASNQLTKYEKSVALLEKLNTLNLDDPSSKKIIGNIYQGLELITKPNQYQTPIIDTISLELRQAIFAALPWLVITLLFVPATFRGEASSRDSALGTIFISLIIAIIGYFFPTKWGVGVYPIGANLLFLVIMAWWGNRIKK